MADGLLPSPSSFYPEWGFGRSGVDSNMLPSPLNFPTPVMQSGLPFPRDIDEAEKKRKNSDGPVQEGAAGKRVKT
jgi:transcription factor RLM1